VTSGGPAEDAGLLPGDLITAADGVPVNDPTDLLGVLARRKPGDILKITYTRDGTQNTVPVTLGATRR
jgi:putative serine protease PepD